MTRLLTAALAATVLALASVSAAAAQSPAQKALEAPPPGANDFSCKPSAAHPNPVVLVHGLGSTMAETWGLLAPYLQQQGWCVFALNYGRNPRVPFPIGGLLPMEESAAELKTFVDEVLAKTGASKVDIVGHSEGSLMPAHYVKFLGGASKVQNYVALAPLWDGTKLGRDGLVYGLAEKLKVQTTGLDAVRKVCGSCPQFVHGSEFLNKLGTGGIAQPDVEHTNIVTRYDAVVQPYTSGILNEPGVENITVQDQCFFDFSDHAWLPYDTVALRNVVNALDPSEPAKPNCHLVFPGRS